MLTFQEFKQELTLFKASPDNGQTWAKFQEMINTACKSLSPKVKSPPTALAVGHHGAHKPKENKENLANLANAAQDTNQTPTTTQPLQILCPVTGAMGSLTVLLTPVPHANVISRTHGHVTAERSLQHTQ